MDQVYLPERRAPRVRRPHAECRLGGSPRRVEVPRVWLAGRGERPSRAARGPTAAAAEQARDAPGGGSGCERAAHRPPHPPRPGQEGKSKDYVWERPDGQKGLGGLRVTDLPLYGVHELPPTTGTPVVLGEGEKARDALTARGIAAVGTVTGASTIPSDDVLKVLVGYDVVCWPDADMPGRQHMDRIAARLRALGATVRWVDPWPEATDGRDAADFTGSTEELRALIVRTTPERDDTADAATTPTPSVAIASL